MKTIALTAFASGAAAASTAAKPADAPVIGAIRTDIPQPDRSSKRGSTSIYPFADLPVNGSFHVKGKTAKQLSTIVSNANRKNKTEKKDDAGNVVFKTQTINAADGTATVVPTKDAEMVATKHFYGVDVDKSDPDGVGVRVFRDL